MFGIGPMELVLILVVALLVLGPKRMPELARTLGRGLGEFRRASNELRQSLALDEIQNELRDGLSGVGPVRRPMKRPDADDPPAQAGADLPAGGADERAQAEATPHPGELPLDADPHAHHDADEDTTGGTDEAPETEATPDDGVRAERASPADSKLGSIPVGGRTPKGGVPAGSDGAGSSERERG